METSLKTGFAQNFSRCPKNLSCPKIWGGDAAPLAPPARTPMILSMTPVNLLTRVQTKKVFGRSDNNETNNRNNHILRLKELT